MIQIRHIKEHPPEKLVPYDEMHHAWSRLRTEHDNRPCRFCFLCGRFEFLDPRFPVKETKCEREVVSPVRAPVKDEEKRTAEEDFRKAVEAGQKAMGRPVPRELENA